LTLRPGEEPSCEDCESTPEVELIVDARPRKLGELEIRRVLPAAKRRMVGPYVFLDHMGPVDFAPGEGIDVPPHPHIGLATVTYLFSGEILHRDSLGFEQAIRPGEINWMTAGSGITHSERTRDEVRAAGMRLEGLQIWVALPADHEEAAPAFRHYPASELPQLSFPGVSVRVLIGSAFGQASPVETASPLCYLDVRLESGSELKVPREHAERAVYVVSGAVRCGAEVAESGRLLVLTPGAAVTLEASSEARLVVIGGEALEGKRHIHWNFVSSSRERIERAKDDYRAGRFPPVVGDEADFVPLPGQ
jgi:redox-sensitive bicupin YhaK (pirin superfamily)